MTRPGLLVLAGGLTGGLLGRTMSRNRGSVIVGMALGALAGAAGDYMSALRQHRALRQQATDEAAVSEMAGYLCQHLSEEVTAYLSGLSETETVRAWARRGTLVPDPEQLSRLEVAYGAALCLVPVCKDEMTRTWFFGMNRSLREKAPAYVLRHWSSAERAAVLSAAQQFAEI